MSRTLCCQLTIPLWAYNVISTLFRVSVSNAEGTVMLCPVNESSLHLCQVLDRLDINVMELAMTLGVLTGIVW